LPISTLYLAAAGLVFAGGLAVYKARPAANNSNAMLISVARGYVRDEIRAELSTSFSSEEETRVEALPDRKYLVSGWVDAIDKNGVAARQSFSCVLFRDGEIWAGEKIAVIPQP
jgi:hypothetical protein